MTRSELIRRWVTYMRQNRIASMDDTEDGKVKYNRPATEDDLEHFLSSLGEFEEKDIRSVVGNVMSRKGGKNPHNFGSSTQNKGTGTDNKAGDQKTAEKPQGPDQKPGQTKPADEPRQQRQSYQKTTGLDKDVTDVDFTDVPHDKEPSVGTTSGAPGPQKGTQYSKATGTNSRTRPSSNQPFNSSRRTLDPSITDIPQNGTQSHDVVVPPSQKVKTADDRKIPSAITEAIYKNKIAEIGEDDVIAVFSELLNKAAKRAKKDKKKNKMGSSDKKAGTDNDAGQAQKTPEQQFEMMNKLRRLIRTKLTDGQRKQLWRELSDNDSLQENAMTRTDIKSVFKSAELSSRNPTTMDKLRGIFKTKKDIDVYDLQKAWAAAGYPDDTVDIRKILTDAGFSSGTIDRIFNEVLGDEYEATDAVSDLAKFIKTQGLRDQVMQFMSKEYRLSEGRKVTIENARSVFEKIAREHRDTYSEINKAYQKDNIGRIRK